MEFEIDVDIDGMLVFTAISVFQSRRVREWIHAEPARKPAVIEMVRRYGPPYSVQRDGRWIENILSAQGGCPACFGPGKRLQPGHFACHESDEQLDRAFEADVIGLSLVGSTWYVTATWPDAR